MPAKKGRYVVLFGAGASAGSGWVKPHSPPLGTELFDRLERIGGVAAALSPELKNAIRTNFESGMKLLATTDTRLLVKFQKEMGRYLSRFRAGPTNLYLSLIRAFGSTQVVYSTLNYDIIFESAALSANKVISWELNDKYLTLLKLHGSVNLWPFMPGCVINESSQFFGADPNSTRFGFVDSPVAFLPFDESDKKYLGAEIGPVISSYAEGKPTRICGPAIESLQKQWRSAVEKADKILIIGVRVIDNDIHIWDPIATSPAEVIYFGYSENDQNEFSAWSAAKNVTRRQILRGGLSDAILYVRRSPLAAD